MSSSAQKRHCEVHDDPSVKKIASECCMNVSVNDIYLKEDFVNALSRNFAQKNSVELGQGGSFLAEPFSCCVMPKFLNSDVYLEHLKEELLQLETNEKDNDLYQFKQTPDLHDASSHHIDTLKKILYEDCLPWIEKITNIPLIKKVDIACSVYDYTDVLLCHDDELEGRRVAFILYLVPEWEKEYGGTLDLFNAENGQPTNIGVSLLPEWNKFVFFEVGPVSFHQVSEILQKKSRVAISGWFYGTPLTSKSVVVEPDLLFATTPLEVDIRTWINPTYLQPDSQYGIKKTFKMYSEIELSDFLQANKYLEVSEALRSCRSSWELVGPANRRHHEIGVNLPGIVKECESVLCSEDMCLVFSNLTGLPFHEMAVMESTDSSADSSNVESEVDDSQDDERRNSSEMGSAAMAERMPRVARFSSVVRRWKHGYYTLLHDSICVESRLDAHIFFNCEEWTNEYGGYTSYSAVDEPDELLRMEPKCNSLALVFTEDGIWRFVKYINSKALGRTENTDVFYDISVSYFR